MLNLGLSKSPAACRATKRGGGDGLSRKRYGPVPSGGADDSDTTFSARLPDRISSYDDTLNVTVSNGPFCFYCRMADVLRNHTGSRM